MGSIRRFNLERLAKQTNATIFFETGTWKGDGLAFAAQYDFKTLYSSEIIQSIAQDAEKRFKGDHRINIIHASSTDALEKQLPQLNGNVIFWLDAHYPGAEEGLNDYNDFEEEVIKLPLERELEIISSRKNKYSDVIIIDDLRIYEKANYVSGNLPDSIIPPKSKDLRIADTLFGETHSVSRYLQDEGYLVLTPKKVSPIPTIKNLYYTISNVLSKKIV